jgi:diacylglycerol kinase family enzyme
MTVAVLLNQNARKVTAAVRAELTSFVPPEDLYWSRSLAESVTHVKTILAKGYDTLFLGGGDGTFVGLVNTLQEVLPQDHADATRWPTIGLLKLGTGNGLCYDLGIEEGFAHLRRAVGGERLPTRDLPLVSADGRLTTFAGTGWDAAVINDFAEWKRHIENPRLRRWAAGLGGYFYATFFRTIPKERRLAGEITAEFINRTPVCFRDPFTGQDVSIGKDEVIYKGPISVAGVSTSPYFGYGLKAFPLCTRNADLMHLRIVSASIFQIVSRLPKLWDGTLRHPGIRDHLVRKVDVRLNMPRPFQIGGDPAGYHMHAAYEISGVRARVIDLSR